MMEIDPPQFCDKDEEIRYWMELANRMHQRKEDAERELEEFQESSQLLEKELEASLEQSEKSNRELRQRISRVVNENEQLRTRLDQQTTDCSVYQTRCQDLQTMYDEVIKYNRELEQKNDDLERAHRVSKVSEEEMEAKFNVAIEKTALLESELDEKESMRMQLQRMKDEIRDLKLEIQVQAHHHQDNEKSVDRVRNRVDSNKIQVELEKHTPPTSPQNLSSPLKIGNGVGGVIGSNNNNNLNPQLAPCTRILAMNMIGDLMRKVGLDRWVCMDCRKVKCSCPGGKKNNGASADVRSSSAQVDTPIQCIRQQPRPAKC